MTFPVVINGFMFAKSVCEKRQLKANKGVLNSDV